MGKSIQSFSQMEDLLGPDRLSEALRGRVREVILKLAEAELAEVLAARHYERNGSHGGIVTASGRDGSARDWERRRSSRPGHGWGRVSRRRNGKVDSSSVISGVLGRSIVRFWAVTSAERTGGG